MGFDNDDEETGHERTPEEEAMVQAIKMAALMIVVLIGPLIERAMSDPDIGYRLRWHWKRLIHQLKGQLHEMEMGIETAIGLAQTTNYLRAEWRRKVRR